MEQNIALKTEGLCCGYGSKFSIRDISFEIRAGQFVSVIGPNGAGKTTLFRGLTGMLPLEKGKIQIEGENAAGMSCKAKARKIAVVNQLVEAGHMTVEDYVLMGRLPYRTPLRFFETEADFRIANESMQQAGIWEKKDRPMNRLSGGEQQLAAIARALTQKTQILLLDEPTAHLDISHQMKVLNLIQRLNRENHLTVLLIIHDLNLASEYSDRLILLKHGQLYATGTPEDVLTYENIEKVYDTMVVTRTNPISGRPFIFPVSESALDAHRKNFQL